MKPIFRSAITLTLAVAGISLFLSVSHAAHPESSLFSLLESRNEPLATLDKATGQVELPVLEPWTILSPEVTVRNGVTLVTRLSLPKVLEFKGYKRTRARTILQDLNDDMTVIRLANSVWAVLSNDQLSKADRLRLVMDMDQVSRSTVEFIAEHYFDTDL